MENYREENDTMGTFKVPKSAYYGVQTERSRQNFTIASDTDKMPYFIIKSLLLLKMSAAEANNNLGVLPKELSEMIVKSCSEILTDYKSWQEQFPLVVWQTGSGTQSNMNVNEVVSNLSNVKFGGKLGDKQPIHPNDHVNKGQSSNDVFPSAMNVATVIALQSRLIPGIKVLRDSLNKKAAEFAGIIKVGRTHLQDAVPITVSQELSAFVSQLDLSLRQFDTVIDMVAKAMAIGATAVGTGLNSVHGFDQLVCERLNENVEKYMHTKNIRFAPHLNKFAALSGHDELSRVNGELNSLATVLMKLANDFRLLGCGPRCGIGEYLLPANEPGSSIMPGKVNPTQCEAVTMVCCQVMGNCMAVTIGASQGQLQLNVYKPMIAKNVLHSITLLADSCVGFSRNCVDGLRLDREKIGEYVDNNIMVATALNPYIGYDKAAKVAKYAYQHKCTLREAAIQLEIVTDHEKLNSWLDCSTLLGPLSPPQHQ